MRQLVFLLIALICAACSTGPGILPFPKTAVPAAKTTPTFTRINLPPGRTKDPSRTPSATPVPSASPMPTHTLTLSITSTPLSTPVTWQLWFYGHTCQMPDGTSVGECGPAWTLEGETYFVVSSDGSGLRALGGTGLPPTSTPYPGFLPPGKYYETAPSPDGAYIAIILDGERLVIFRGASEEPVLSFKPELSSPGGDYKMDTLCWNADSSALRFLALQRDDRKRRVNFGVYTIRLDGSPPGIMYPPPGIEDTVKGVCSPDGTEMIFANWSSDAGMAGLYRINLHTGEAIPLLQGYHIAVLSTIPFK